MKWATVQILSAPPSSLSVLVLTGESLEIRSVCARFATTDGVRQGLRPRKSFESAKTYPRHIWVVPSAGERH